MIDIDCWNINKFFYKLVLVRLHNCRKKLTTYQELQTTAWDTEEIIISIVCINNLCEIYFAYSLHWL